MQHQPTAVCYSYLKYVSGTKENKAFIHNFAFFSTRRTGSGCSSNTRSLSCMWYLEHEVWWFIGLLSPHVYSMCNGMMIIACNPQESETLVDHFTFIDEATISIHDQHFTPKTEVTNDTLYSENLTISFLLLRVD